MIRSTCKVFGVACGYRTFDSVLDKLGADTVLENVLGAIGQWFGAFTMGETLAMVAAVILINGALIGGATSTWSELRHWRLGRLRRAARTRRAVILSSNSI